MRLGAETKDTSIFWLVQEKVEEQRKQTNAGPSRRVGLKCFKRISSIWKMNVAVTFINEKSFANYAEQRAGVLY